ncbi:transcription factor MUTE-like [Hibiscus syriacus]|uniref:transcription factor MUTE-like n=1 Tax=Hibiscus syriacus TaxID=106335 RepID=UPI001923311D|nr:transcription factor MUTE-like [Hibiscus syriacus]
MSHIAVKRNRKRQLNEHLKVLRSLTPCFYIKRGDQASIIGGVIEFIKEVQQVLQSLESKKQRKSLSPSPSPSTPKSLHLPAKPNPMGEVGACFNSSLADVEARISGSNVLLKIVCQQIPGQILKIVAVLEKFSFDVLHLNISRMEETVLYSFVIKIGLECQLSLEELATEVQQSFFSEPVFLNEI